MGPHLPQVQPKEAKVIILVQAVIRLVLGIGDLRVHPLSLVVRVVNLLGPPLTLEGGKKGKERPDLGLKRTSLLPSPLH